jgi:hypothetical protein
VKAVALLAVLLAPLAAAGDTTFRVDSTPGPTQLELYGDGAMRLRLAGPTDLETSTRALTELLAQAFPRGSIPAERTSIDLGRIVEHPWLSQQLAEAAMRSSRWDAARGRPTSGNDNLAVMLLIDDGKLLAAWVPIFGRYGVKIRNASVEKVLVGRVGETAELAPLAADPSALGKKLPFDAILWLHLEPIRAASNRP